MRVTAEEVCIVLIVFSLWVWACALFYIRFSDPYYLLFDIFYPHLTRWQKISRLETCNDYRPEPELLPTAVTPEAGQAEAAERLTEAGDKFDK